MLHRYQVTVCLFLLMGMFVPEVHAQTFDEQFDAWPVDLKINGTIVVIGGGEIPSDLNEAIIRYAGGEKAKFVVLDFSSPTTGEISKADKVIDDETAQTRFQIAEGFNDSIGAIPTAIKESNGVIMLGDVQTVMQQSLFKSIHGELKTLIDRGGVILANGKVATLLGSKENSASLIPDSVLLTNYDHQSDFAEMMATLSDHPRSVGIGVEPNAAIVLRGRKIHVVGEGTATFSLLENEHKPVRFQHLREATSRSDNPYETIIDLTAWRRDAIERTVGPFPSKHPEKPFVENGTLIIVGGGGTPSGLMERMVELAGGKDAHMVYVPCEEEEEVSANQRMVETWKKMGVASAITFHTKDRIKANSDKEFLEPLTKATGIWFGGGRQWNLADSYYGTEAHRLMKDVLHRGGVIGGSSAGASIQGRYMCRANPVANYDIMAPGYERGLGFLSGVAIDQHFTQRGRQKDMTQLANHYPQLLGIGLDESTAIIVQKSTADVIGKGKVFFYDCIDKPIDTAKEDYIALEAGSSFDLVKREVIESSKE